MAALLSERGYDVVAVFDPSEEASARASELCGALSAGSAAEVAARARVILITTPDSEVEAACASIVEGGTALGDRIVVHMSGALKLASLKAAADVGADTLSIHPVQTFADLQGAIEAIPGSTFGVTCDPEMLDWASDFVASLGGRVVPVADDDKVLYHAAAAIACNLLVMVEYGALVACGQVGFTEGDFAEAFAPLISRTATNVSRLGPVEALTGPLARGDVETVREHIAALEAVDRELAAMYRAVSRWGLRLLCQRGDLDEAVVEDMRELLG